jgi:hypothetical protein
VAVLADTLVVAAAPVDADGVLLAVVELVPVVVVLDEPEPVEQAAMAILRIAGRSAARRMDMWTSIDAGCDIGLASPTGSIGLPVDQVTP